jgi:HPt (histidine-containing phosphotransfer) domain-containing protein
MWSSAMKQLSEVPWNMSKTLEQLGGDLTLFQEVMDIFLAEAPIHLAALRLAVKRGQAETVERTAHTLKGEVGYLGIPGISQTASQIEEMGRSNNVGGAANLLAQSKPISTACLLQYAVQKPWLGTAPDHCSSLGTIP